MNLTPCTFRTPHKTANAPAAHFVLRTKQLTHYHRAFCASGAKQPKHPRRAFCAYGAKQRRKCRIEEQTVIYYQKASQTFYPQGVRGIRKAAKLPTAAQAPRTAQIILIRKF